jgi:hypothetical protein
VGDGRPVDSANGEIEALTGELFLRKTLTANDVGATGSHQAGFHVPKSMIAFFPPLDEALSNPDMWLEIIEGPFASRWRYVYYNSALNGSGTRDEFRLTHTSAFLRSAGAVRGDQLELSRLGPATYAARIVRSARDEGALVLNSSGPWRLVRI